MKSVSLWNINIANKISVAALAKEKSVTFADGAKDLEIIGLDFSQDFYDGSHLNESGAAKYTEYFADNYLKDMLAK